MRRLSLFLVLAVLVVLSPPLSHPAFAQFGGMGGMGGRAPQSQPTQTTPTKNNAVGPRSS